MTIRLATTTLLLAVSACKANTARVPQAPGVPAEYAFIFDGGIASESATVVMNRIPYDSITLWRDACLGWCPVYRLTLHRDGRARYFGESNVPRVGQFHGEVHLFEYSRLAYMLDDLGFMTLDSNYAAAWTDAPTATLSASRRPQGTKTVRDYGEVGPIRLWTMRQAIDEIASHINWIRDST